jgi:hypothetical protein
MTGTEMRDSTTRAAGWTRGRGRPPTDTSQAEYITYPEDPYRSPLPGFSLGGPIARDEAWFYVAFQPQLRYTDRTVTFALDGSTNTFHQDGLRSLRWGDSGIGG